MKILLMHRDPDGTDILSFILKDKLHAEVFSAPNDQLAIDILLREGAVDLILTDFGKESGQMLLAFLNKSGARIPTLGLAKKPFPMVDKVALPNFLGFVDLNRISDELLPTIDHWVYEGSIYLGQKDVDFCEIRTELLLRLSPLRMDVFIRLAGDHFVKLFNKDQNFTQENFEQVRFRKNQEYLFVRKKDCDKVVEKLLKELARVISSSEDSDGDLHRMAVSTHETVVELTTRLGFTSEVQELARANVELALKTIGRDPIISEALAKMNSSGSRFLSAHSLVTASIACSISTLLNWPSDSTFQKLAFAAVCHDLSLGDSKAIKTENLEVLREQLSPEELQNFRRHPLQSALLIQHCEGVPPDVGLIIEQHHEHPYGTGFPKGLNGLHIAPLSSVFIVAHDIVEYSLQNGIDKFSMKSFLHAQAAKYSSGHFKVIAKAMRENAIKD